VVPPNTTATIYIPAAKLADVLEGGRPAIKASGVSSCLQTTDAAIFEVGSGKYNFTVNQ